ncbi:MAG: YdbH domain-containing protein [Hyphomonadaceae bacterium]
MTEEKLSRASVKTPIGRIIGLFVAAIAILTLGIWFFRQPIAEAIARGVCAEQELSCKFTISKLDFGGVTLTSIDVRAPGSNDAAVTAREIDIGLAWDSPFAARAASVAGDALTLRLDLTGKRSVFGDLDKAITTFTKPSDKPPGPNPRLQLANLTIIGDTLSGPIVAKGRITAADAKAFVVELTATPTSMGLSGATVDITAANLNATVAGENISGRVNLDVAKFSAADARLANIKIDATLEQSAGRLRGEGTASLGDLQVNDVSLSDAQATASLEAGAFGGATPLGDWLANVRRLQIDASTGEGEYAGASWKRSKLTTLVQPVGDTGSGGDLALVVDDLRASSFAAGQTSVTGKIVIAAGRVGSADGVVTVKSGLLPAQQRQSVVNGISGPFTTVLPPYAEVLRRTVDRAAQNFDASIPWSVRSNADSFVVSLKSGAVVKAHSGLSLTASAPADKTVVGAYTSAADDSWTAAGDITLQGGGGPTLVLDIDHASGAGEKMSAAGNAYVRTWKVGTDVFAADFMDLNLSADGAAGAAAGNLLVQIDGGMAGGVWKAARAEAVVNASWDANTFIAEAPRGALLQWKEARFGGSVFGASALRYTPIGHLAERSGEGYVGKGQLAPVTVPVKGDGYDAAVQLGAIGVNWRAQRFIRANFNMAPAKVDLTLDQRKVPIRVGDVAGEIDLSNGWKVTGAFKDASAETEEGHVADLKGAFDLAGSGGSLSGSLSGITMRLFDPLEEEGRRYEDVNFRGEGRLNNSLVDFTGTFTMAKSGMQVAHVTGQHNLEDNEGGLTFEPTPLIFKPRQFQPSDLSPFLVGPANVTGRVDIAGAATWASGDLKASGVLDLKQLGFALASAGVFEGVSGRIEVADLLNMKSAPGQKLTLDKVTLGLPIESGQIAFSLIGYEAIRLESAQWPFGGGFIRVDPQDFKFSSEAENRIVARAVNWDLAKLADQFKLPDMKLQGIVAGEFPVMFTTGSAVIDHATLKSVRPGVIQYSGSTGDAAAQADENSKMLFDALKDFHYEVLQVGLDGNLTGNMLLTLSILGRNPDVMSGQPFQLNIGVDSALVPLLTSTMQRPDVRTAIEQVREQQK